jgi:murein L,D-transpeptidase YafK
MYKTLTYLLCIIALLFSGSILAAEAEIDFVLVKKSESKMYLLSKGKTLKEYEVAFGADPEGHKQKEGDEKTPEGKYTLDYKKEDSAFFKAIHISYPNAADMARSKAANLNPGGQIMIHGQRNGLGWLAWITQWFDWTDGCIAVTNEEMEEIWRMIEVGTPIEIKP